MGRIRLTRITTTKKRRKSKKIKCASCGKAL